MQTEGYWKKVNWTFLKILQNRQKILMYSRAMCVTKGQANRAPYPLCSRELPYTFNSLGRELSKTALDVPNTSMSPGLGLKLNFHVKI